MLKFFRRIRQKLLAESRFSKYSLYAVGEIFLVVIGILIALQVNNWNEGRKSYEKQKGYLLLIKKEMENNLEAIRTEKQKQWNALEQQRKWVALIDSTSADISERELSRALAGATNFSAAFRYENGVLTEMKSSGVLKDILNQDIKNILASWEGRVAKVKKQEGSVNEQMAKCNDYIEKYGDFRSLFQENKAHLWIKVDPTSNNNSNKHLLASQEFENMIILALGNGEYLYSGVYPVLENDIQLLITMINEELGIPKKKFQLELAGYEDAKTVAVVGDFNSWNDSIGQMVKTNKVWTKTLELFPGSYQYKFLINKDNYITDLQNPDSIFVPYIGSYNSVLNVE